MRLPFGIRLRHPLGRVRFHRGLRLLVVRPVGWGEDTQEGPFREHRRPGLLASTRVDLIYCAGAPAVIDDEASCAAAAPHVVEKAKWGEAHGYHAVVVGCMLDPGLEQARRAVGIPVVGTRQAVTTVASLVGERPAFVVPEGIDVPAFEDDPARTFRELVASGRRALSRERADVVAPGCTLLAGLAQPLKAELGVPVLPTEDLALRLAELLAGFRVLPGR